jgi:hypothetical protein
VLYSVGTTLAYLVYLGFAWRVARAGGLAAGRSAGRAEDAATATIDA